MIKVKRITKKEVIIDNQDLLDKLNLTGTILKSHGNETSLTIIFEDRESESELIDEPEEVCCRADNLCEKHK